MALGNPASVAKFQAAKWKGTGVIYEGDKLSHFTAEWAIQLPYQNRIVAKVEQNGAVLQAISVMNADAGWDVMNGEVKAMDTESFELGNNAQIPKPTGASRGRIQLPS